MMRIAHGTIVLAADGKKALLLRNEGDEKYAVLQTLSHDETAYPPTRATGSDQPGRSFSSTEARRSGYGDTDWHRQTEDRFARRAASLLLRERLASSVKRRLVAEIDKDLVHHETDQIAAAISRHLEKVG